MNRKEEILLAVATAWDKLTDADDQHDAIDMIEELVRKKERGQELGEQEEQVARAAFEAFVPAFVEPAKVLLERYAKSWGFENCPWRSVDVYTIKMKSGTAITLDPEYQRGVNKEYGYTTQTFTGIYINGTGSGRRGTGQFSRPWTLAEVIQRHVLLNRGIELPEHLK